jgi:hypothetical protein
MGNPISMTLNHLNRRVNVIEPNHILNHSLPLGNCVSLPLAAELKFALQFVSPLLLVVRICAGNLGSGSYLGLVGNVGQDTGDDTHVHDR